MIVVKETDDVLSPFNNGGVHGYTDGFNKNYFLQMPTYKAITPRHELGHCNGLDEFAYDFGLTTVAATPRIYLNNNEYQRKTSNVMGYNNNKVDFYSWQIKKLRQNISDRNNGLK